MFDEKYPPCEGCILAYVLGRSEYLVRVCTECAENDHRYRIKYINPCPMCISNKKSGFEYPCVNCSACNGFKYFENRPKDESVFNRIEAFLARIEKEISRTDDLE